MRRKKTGALLTTGGRLRCRWRENGKTFLRDVQDEREGRRLLMDVADYRAAGLDLEEAIRKAAGEDDAPEPARETTTMAVTVARYLEHIKSKRTPENFRHERSRSLSITDHVIAQVRADLIRRRDVARWMDALSADKGDRTINRCLSFASKAWRWAYDHGYVPEDQPNPFRQVTRAREPNLDKDHLTHEEGRAIVEATPEDFRPLVVVALATGMRLGELLSLAWADVDLEARTIVIRAENEKARGGRRVDMTPEVTELLTRLKATARGWPVFLTDRHRPHSTHSIRNRMARLRKAEPKIARHKLVNLKFKDFRDSAICLMLEDGAPTATVARIVGHRTLATTEKYLSELRLGQRAVIDRYGERRFGT